MPHNGRNSRQFYEDWNAFLKSLHPNTDPQASRLMEDFRLVAHQFHHLNEASMEASGLSYAQNRILLHLMFSEWQGRRDGLNPS